jgi:hypothetical protein
MHLRRPASGLMLELISQLPGLRRFGSAQARAICQIFKRLRYVGYCSDSVAAAINRLTVPVLLILRAPAACAPPGPAANTAPGPLSQDDRGGMH